MSAVVARAVYHRITGTNHVVCAVSTHDGHIGIGESVGGEQFDAAESMRVSRQAAELHLAQAVTLGQLKLES